MLREIWKTAGRSAGKGVARKGHAGRSAGKGAVRLFSHGRVLASTFASTPTSTSFSASNFVNKLLPAVFRMSPVPGHHNRSARGFWWRQLL